MHHNSPVPIAVPQPGAAGQWESAAGRAWARAGLTQAEHGQSPPQQDVWCCTAAPSSTACHSSAQRWARPPAAPCTSPAQTGDVIRVLLVPETKARASQSHPSWACSWVPRCGGSPTNISLCVLQVFSKEMEDWGKRPFQASDFWEKKKSIVF